MLFQFLTSILVFAYGISAKAVPQDKPSKPNNPPRDEDDPSACKSYTIKLSDEYNALKGIKPADTEVFKEATANGLVPVQITTTFASPAAIEIGSKLPDTLRKVMLVFQQNDRTAVEYEQDKTYSFLSGNIVDALAEADSEGDKKDDKSGDKTGKGENLNSADSKAAGGNNKSAPAVKLNESPKEKSKQKLLSNQERPNLREQEDQPSDSLLMQREE